jgi:transcription antitermination factor NusG
LVFRPETRAGLGTAEWPDRFRKPSGDHWRHLVLYDLRRTGLLKIHENPPILWPQAESIEGFQGQWWVAHTKSRNEKALAHDLMAKDISYFLPMTMKVSRRSHRTLKSMLPLFTGYLFFCGHDNDRIELLKTNRVANLLEVTDQDELLRELLRGQWCRVIAGPLLGLEGIVVQHKGGPRLVLQVDMLGQAASVEVDVDMIEPIEERRAP